MVNRTWLIGESGEIEDRMYRRHSRYRLVAMVVLVLALAGMTMAGLIRRREHIEDCWGDLSLIASVKGQVAAERGLTNGQSVAWSDLDALVTPKVPRKCPSGGSLSIGAVGGLPLCSLHGELTNDMGEFKRRNWAGLFWVGMWHR